MDTILDLGTTNSNIDDKIRAMIQERCGNKATIVSRPDSWLVIDFDTPDGQAKALYRSEGGIFILMEDPTVDLEEFITIVKADLIKDGL